MLAPRLDGSSKICFGMPASTASIKMKEDLHEHEEANPCNERNSRGTTCEKRHDETKKSASQSSTDRRLYPRGRWQVQIGIRELSSGDESGLGTKEEVSTHPDQSIRRKRANSDASRII